MESFGSKGDLGTRGKATTRREADEQVGKRLARRRRGKAGVGSSDASGRKDMSGSSMVSSSSSLKGTQIIARGETLGKSEAVGLPPVGDQQLADASVRSGPA